MVTRKNCHARGNGCPCVPTVSTCSTINAISSCSTVGASAIYATSAACCGSTITALDDTEVLDELERLILDFNPVTAVIFRANHASNVYSLGGTIPEDKEKLLTLISELKLRPELLKPKILRRF
jgi:hypothetical protein